MFFRKKEFLKKIRALQAVQKDFSYFQSNSHCKNHILHDGRMSPCTSVKKQGSLTVEAALVFPFFLFVLTALLYLLLLQQLQTEVGRALTDTGRELSWKAYASQGSASLTAQADGKKKVREYLKGRQTEGILKDGAEGITVLGIGTALGDSMITLRADYQVLLPLGLSWFHPIKITQTKTVRGWTGFSSRRRYEGEKGEEVVYVTNYGTVYHRSLDCRHLKLSIRQVSVSDAEHLRNENGGKYYPCERCWKSGSGAVYITMDGNRCHESLNCSSLIRSIRTVRISETGGMPPCSICGG